jgi:hypothetical protein
MSSGQMLVCIPFRGSDATIFPMLISTTVEVAPIYDNPGETTVLAAAEIAHSLLTLMVQKPVKSLADRI